MGRGSSGLAGGGGGNAGTPSGISYSQFMLLPDAQKYTVMEGIINNPNIKVPNYLDNSDTSKVLYALGMDNKPTVVSDAQLDAISGREIFRTVYDASSKVTSDMILDQIRNGDYTQMSGSGGSAHGRALYFATDFYSSAIYGSGMRNPMIMRAKINSNANIRRENSIWQQMNGDAAWNKSKLNASYTDSIALYAISHGIDGWFSGKYTMMVNRGALTASSQNKGISHAGGSILSSWSSAPNR